MKTMKLFLLMLIAIISFTACSKDDEMNAEPARGTFTQNVIEYGTNSTFMKIKFTITGNPQTVDLTIRVDNANVGDYTNAHYQQSHDEYFLNLELDPDEYPTGSELTPELYIDGLLATTATTVVVDWGDGTTDPVDTDLEKINITSISQMSLSGDMIVTKNVFSQNSYNTGELKMRLFYSGDEIGNDTNTFVGTNGSTTSSYSHSDIQGNRTYQVLIENIDTSNPVYAFVNADGEIIVDADDKPVSSIVLEFTTLAVTANIVSQTPNIGTTSIVINSEVSTNSNESQNITVKLFPQGNTTAISTSPIFETPTGGANLVIYDLLFDGLTESHYDVKYFLNNSTTPFATYTLTMLSSGSFSAVFGTINKNVNGGDIQVIWGNQSGMDIDALWKFSGTGIDGNDYMYTEPINFINGLINQSSIESITGFKQNSTITVAMVINDVEYVSTSFITHTIDYSHFQNLNMSNTTASVAISPNQGNMNRTQVRVDADGNAKIHQVLLRLTSTNGSNPNSYTDNWSFDGSQNFDLNFVETSTGSGIWNATLSISEDVSSGMNTYTVGIGSENYTVSTPGMSDDFGFQVLLVDDNNITIGESANSIILKFNE